ncbi:ABC-2 family transporter protein [Levilactobacillus fujinensis]|uniref:ABC-2 family transporter protein n=1 Tax=Levilactobacillus fujinensis TaxID=2486024 RepID=A0ABW1THL8_9LACO|nr:ABC-2 family transporter protein [Levilactobacillus fujinensis]
MKYWVTCQNALMTTLAYRGNLFLHLLTTAINVLVTIFMWLAVYNFSGRSDIAGIRPNQMVLYLIVVNVLALIFSAEPIFKFSGLVRSGNLSVVLMRPINYFIQSFWDYLGRAIPYLFVYGLATAIVSPVFHRGLLYGLSSFLLMVITYGMFFLLVTAISLCTFWLVQVWPLRPVLSALFLLLGGQAFPLQVLPPAFSWLIYNPFSLAGNQLTLLLLGKLSLRQVATAGSWAMLWTVVTLALLKLTWHRGIRSYEGVGS